MRALLLHDCWKELTLPGPRCIPEHFPVLIHSSKQEMELVKGEKLQPASEQLHQTVDCLPFRRGTINTNGSCVIGNVHH